MNFILALFQIAEKPDKKLESTDSNKDRETQELKKEELMYNLIQRRYDAELQRAKDLDQKAGNLIGYVTIVTGILVGLGTFSILGKLADPRYYIPYFVGIAFLLFSIYCSLVALKVRQWYTYPTYEELEGYLDDEDVKYRSIVRKTFCRMGEALSSNFKKNETKAKWTTSSWSCLVIGLIFIAAYVVIYTISGNLVDTETEISSNADIQLNDEIRSKLMDLIENKSMTP